MVLKFSLVVALLLVFTVSQTSFVHAQETESSISFLYDPAIEGVTAFATVVAEAAPKIIAAFILLIIGLIVGKVISRVVEKAASKLLSKVAKHENDGSVISETTSPKDSSKLIATSVRWFVYIFFIISAINALEFEQLSSALTDLWLWIPNLLAFILIIVIGMIIANVIGKWLDQELIKSELGGTNYIKSGVKIVIYAIIVAISLTQLGIGEEVIPILITAFSWSIAIAVGASIAMGLGFALKDILPAAINSASRQKHILKVGQKVKIAENSGTITASELLYIILSNENNESVVIPTKNIQDKIITIFGSVEAKE